MVDLDRLLTDLDAESADLYALVAPLPDTGWATPTPAPGWTVAHQIAHLAWADRMALLAATDAEQFLGSLAPASADPTGFVDHGAEEFLASPPDLLDRWRAGRAALATVLAGMPAGTRLPWYGPPMSVASMVTARLMETWAHGQDVADALGVTRVPTDRLRHVAHLGVRTLGNGFVARGLDVPEQPVRVELLPPATAATTAGTATNSGADGRWAWGPANAADRVTGPAIDFCLLVTQRRHRADLALRATGPIADAWLDVAQAFAGPPGAGRAPRGARNAVASS